MTKSQLLTDLEGKSFVNQLIGDPELIGTPFDGASEYEQQILEVGDTYACVCRSIRFYVIDEDGEGEIAYYKNNIPVAQIEE